MQEEPALLLLEEMPAESLQLHDKRGDTCPSDSASEVGTLAWVFQECHGGGWGGGMDAVAWIGIGTNGGFFFGFSRAAALRRFLAAAAASLLC